LSSERNNVSTVCWIVGPAPLLCCPSSRMRECIECDSSSTCYLSVNTYCQQEEGFGRYTRVTPRCCAQSAISGLALPRSRRVPRGCGGGTRQDDRGPLVAGGVVRCGA
jgi:hypothetical protein